jgi:putative transposase
MAYPSDLTDKQWHTIKELVGRPDPRGAKPTYDRREIIDAILYVNKTGCQWRMLPSHFPPWQNVYNHFRRMKLRGTWQEVCCKLNEITRQKKGDSRHRATSSSTPSR